MMNENIVLDTPAGATDVHAVSIRDLTFHYIGQENPILNHINLEIRPGELIVLMGATGSGKSTLSLCLNGVIPRVIGGDLHGEIKIDGWSPAEKEIYEMATKIGLVFQDADSQICNIFVRDEVAFGAQNLCVEKEEILKRINRALKFVGLETFEDRSVFALSGGEKQRLSIASVLAMEPKVIILDEPTANLDPQGTAEVKALVKELTETHGVTIIIIEHNISGLLQIADRMVLLDAGSIVYDGPPREILGQYGTVIREKLGLRIPEATEFALAAQKKGYRFEPMPVITQDIDASLLEFKPAADIPMELLESAPAVAEPIVTMHDVNFQYPNGFKALNNVNLTIPRGDILAILGQNGSGKSTLTSLLIGLNRPISGQVIVDNLDASKTTIRELAKRVGYVFQYPEHQFVTDTVYEEMAFGLKSLNFSEEEICRQALEMLEMFHLDHLKERHPLALSRGQKRRLSVASMLVMRPKLFILDEPTTGQDRRNIEQVMQYLSTLNKAGLTVIIVTHDMELVAAYAKRVLVMEKGHVAFEGTTWQLFGEEIATADKYSLTTPDIFKLYQQVKPRFPWLPPTLVPAKLADMLLEKGK
jgi:energy-coupling factor transport system ATP-binding protein